MNKRDRQSPESTGDTTWPYLLAGYVIGFVVAHVLAQRAAVGQKTGALIGGVGIGLSGRSMGSPGAHRRTGPGGGFSSAAGSGEEVAC